MTAARQAGIRLARKIREIAAETWRSIFGDSSTEWGECS